MFNDPSPGAGSSAMDSIDDSKLPKFSEIDPATATPEVVAEVVQAAQTLLGQRKHWHAKAIDPETKKPFSEIVTELKKKPPQDTPPRSPSADPAIDERLSRVEQAEEKRQFGHKNNLAPEETDHLFAYAKGMGKKPEEVINDAFFKGGLDNFRQTSRNNGATPNPSHRAPTVEGKTFGQMKPEERRNNFEKVVGVVTKK